MRVCVRVLVFACVFNRIIVCVDVCFMVKLNMVVKLKYHIGVSFEVTLTKYDRNQTIRQCVT